ncbi:MAG TPA: hypothetical protein VGL81_20145 [Polyangiaceae bacterium]|jgi:hypothetical protein
MRGFVLQDWVTIRGATTITQVIQNEANWLSLEMFQDAIFWLQVTELTLGGGSLGLNYETAPIKDESLFQAMPTPASAPSVAITTATLTPNLLAVKAASATLPISRWVRWRLVPASATSTWDVTFRILVSCNQLFTTGMAGGYGGGAGWGQQMR